MVEKQKNATKGKPQGPGRPSKYAPGVEIQQKPIRMSREKWVKVEMESKMLTHLSNRSVSQNEVVERALDEYFGSRIAPRKPAKTPATE